jgi:hypothetical protein
MNALSCIDQCFITQETLEQLPAPVPLGKTRVGGIDFNKPNALGRTSRSRTFPLFPTASPLPSWPNTCEC